MKIQGTCFQNGLLKVLENKQNILELFLTCSLRYSKKIFKLFPNYSYRVPLNASYPTLQSFVSPSHHLHKFTCTMYKLNIRIFLSCIQSDNQNVSEKNLFNFKLSFCTVRLRSAVTKCGPEKKREFNGKLDQI